MNETEHLVKSKALSIIEDALKKSNDVRGSSIKLKEIVYNIAFIDGPEWYMTYYNDQTCMFDKLSLIFHTYAVFEALLQSETKG